MGWLIALILNGWRSSQPYLLLEFIFSGISLHIALLVDVNICGKLLMYSLFPE